MRHPSRSSSSASTVAHRQRQGCTASSSGAAASSAAADQHPSCPATWIVGLALLFAATTTDRMGARQLAGRFLPEYDFENANHHFQEPRCSFYGQDESMTGNESNDRTFGWFTSSSSSPSSGGAKEGTPDADKLVSGAKCSSGGQQSSDSETSSDQWRPDSGSSDAAATASVVGERRSRRTASSSKRRRSRSRRRSTQTPSRSSDPTSSASEEVLSTGRKAGSSGSATPSNTSFLAATIAATTIAVASAAALCAGSVAHVLKTVTAPSPTARFVPLPATFVESSPPEAADRSTIQWSCQVCCSPFLQSGTRSCCNECHAPFEKAALRLFVGQLRKDCTAEYARWLFATFAPHISILHVEAHTTKGVQRTRGAGFVHVASKRDAEELCELLNKRIFADVVIEPESKTRVEGVWFVDRDDVQALVQYAQTRTAAKDRPFVLPRQPCVVEQRGHPDENAKSFRDAFRPRRFGEQPLRSEGKEGLDATTTKAAQQQRRQRRDVSAASSPLPVASAPRKQLPYCHDPYNWNPFVAQQQHQLSLAFPQYSYHGDYESTAAW